MSKLSKVFQVRHWFRTWNLEVLSSDFFVRSLSLSLSGDGLLPTLLGSCGGGVTSSFLLWVVAFSPAWVVAVFPLLPWGGGVPSLPSGGCLHFARREEESAGEDGSTTEQKEQTKKHDLKGTRRASTTQKRRRM